MIVSEEVYCKTTECAISSATPGKNEQVGFCFEGGGD